MGTPQKCQHFWEGAAQKGGEGKAPADILLLSSSPLAEGRTEDAFQIHHQIQGCHWAAVAVWIPGTDAGRGARPVHPPGGGEHLTRSGADRRGSAGAGRFFPRLSRARTVGAGVGGTLTAHPSWPILPGASPALRAGVPWGHPRHAHPVQVGLPWPRTCRAKRVGDRRPVKTREMIGFVPRHMANPWQEL